MAKGKPSQVTLATGEVIDGNLKGISWRKCVYEAIEFTDNNGKDYDFKAADLTCIYGYLAGLEKLGKRMEFGANVKSAISSDYDFERLGKGMILFEQTDVKMKKKQFSVLMQLLNPDFWSAIKVYRDPFETETTKWGVGGITLAGGDVRSYYVRKGNDIAYRISKKDFKDSFKVLFADNEEMIKIYGDKPIWYDLAKYIVEYSESKK